MANKPKPTALKLLQGNPGKRPLNKREPHPLGPLSPTPPRWLAKEARAEWRRVAPELIRTGVATRIDRALFCAYCQLWGRFVEGEKAGKPVTAAETAQLRFFAAEFGMTPAARTRIQVRIPESASDPLDELRNRRVG